MNVFSQKKHKCLLLRLVLSGKYLYLESVINITFVGCGGVFLLFGVRGHEEE